MIFGLTRFVANARYQTAMLRQLNEVQGDDSVVGFYQSCTLGGFLRQSLIEQQALHQEKLRHGGIVVVHGEYSIFHSKLGYSDVSDRHFGSNPRSCVA